MTVLEPGTNQTMGTEVTVNNCSGLGSSADKVLANSVGGLSINPL